MKRALAHRVVDGVVRAGAWVIASANLRDTFVFGGLASVGYGIWQIHQPSAFIAVGAVLFLLGSRR